MGDLWIIVNNVVSQPQTYIMLPSEVKDLAHEGVSKTGRISYWLQPKVYCLDEFHEAWERVDNVTAAPLEGI